MASVPETSACDSLSFIMETAMIMVDFTWCPFGYKENSHEKVGLCLGPFVDKEKSLD